MEAAFIAEASYRRILEQDGLDRNPNPLPDN